ncbi:MAG TPA: helix-hairpin-helix domain-containing protein [Usitatibacter sp.]|jgi:DNA polymerase/3'-5' exonuclease PolX|nr:helix-hairpin-helix domain-containing protein [Usitatibacter sp.]
MASLPRAQGTNRRIAERLAEAARLLQAQGASRYRVKAYRNAARGVASHPRPLPLVFAQGGVRGLDGIPGVGLGIAAGIEQMLRTGRWSLLQHLRASSRPAVVLQAVPGMGPALARRVHEELRISTLEGLHEAARDGRLDAFPGVGPRRASAWRAVLDDMLDRAA